MKKRCECSPCCPNPPIVVIDVKTPSMGFHTKRICIPAGRMMLADLIGTEAEAQEERDRRAASLRTVGGKEKI